MRFWEGTPLSVTPMRNASSSSSSFASFSRLGQAK